MTTSYIQYKRSRRSGVRRLHTYIHTYIAGQQRVSLFGIVISKLGQFLKPLAHVLFTFGNAWTIH